MARTEMATKEERLQERLALLEKSQRATLNLLEDFDEEKGKLAAIQQATMNLLEDFDAERRKYQQIQTATVNLLEDMDEERARLNESQRALVNMLEDIEAERANADQSRVLLEAVNKELESFSYSVSHDLRAPLRAISGFSDAIIEDYAAKLDEDGRRYLDLIQENAHSMGQLIDDLLSFSRLGRQEISTTEIDMEALVTEVCREVSRDTSGRKIEFRILHAPPAIGDHTLIRIVLTNLLSNAVKFTRPKSDPLIEFGFSFTEDGGAYYVKDNGVGFDMKYVGKLFGVFQRLHSDTEFEGTGVGLATVYRIVTRHGGRMWAEAELGEGATFFFSLPRTGDGGE